MANRYTDRDIPEANTLMSQVLANDGPGSGIDADKVGGKDRTDIATEEYLENKIATNAKGTQRRLRIASVLPNSNVTESGCMEYRVPITYWSSGPYNENGSQWRYRYAGSPEWIVDDVIEFEERKYCVPLDEVGVPIEVSVRVRSTNNQWTDWSDIYTYTLSNTAVIIPGIKPVLDSDYVCYDDYLTFKIKDDTFDVSTITSFSINFYGKDGQWYKQRNGVLNNTTMTFKLDREDHIGRDVCYYSLRYTIDSTYIHHGPILYNKLRIKDRVEHVRSANIKHGLSSPETIHIDYTPGSEKTDYLNFVIGAAGHGKVMYAVNMGKYRVGDSVRDYKVVSMGIYDVITNEHTAIKIPLDTKRILAIGASDSGLVYLYGDTGVHLWRPYNQWSPDKGWKQIYTGYFSEDPYSSSLTNYESYKNHFIVPSKNKDNIILKFPRFTGIGPYYGGYNVYEVLPDGSVGPITSEGVNTISGGGPAYNVSIGVDNKRDLYVFKFNDIPNNVGPGRIYKYELVGGSYQSVAIGNSNIPSLVKASVTSYRPTATLDNGKIVVLTTMDKTKLGTYYTANAIQAWTFYPFEETWKRGRILDGSFYHTGYLNQPYLGRSGIFHDIRVCGVPGTNKIAIVGGYHSYRGAGTLVPSPMLRIYDI